MTRYGNFANSLFGHASLDFSPHRFAPCSLLLASLIARSSSFFLLMQTTAFAHLLGGLGPRAFGPVVELGIPIPSDQC